MSRLCDKRVKELRDEYQDSSAPFTLVLNNESLNKKKKVVKDVRSDQKEEKDQVKDKEGEVIGEDEQAIQVVNAKVVKSAY